MKSIQCATALLLLCVRLATAEETLCARVKIQIDQEVSFERQAFDANMTIENASGHTLEDIRVDVQFRDKTGNAVLATSDSSQTSPLYRFFIRTSTMSGIANIAGNGKVAPSTTANIHWLIVPAPGAGGANPAGELYYVGARLTYKLGGEVTTNDVVPDAIYVKPMPDLSLDYFIPEYVLGDDPLTEEIEPVVPYSLGVRVRNDGHGAARNLKIQSAQPRIVENEQGLLVGFEILGSEVNDQPATKSLLVAFGDIEPSRSKVAAWKMVTTLMGRFVSLEATYQHATELGGQLTSLIRAVNTHLLVHEVVVDLPGRDKIRDFLARNVSKDADGQPLPNVVPYLKVFESDASDSSVTDLSSQSSLSFVSQQDGVKIYTLTLPSTPGPAWAEIHRQDLAGELVQSAVRDADGKQIDLRNIWISQKRDKAQAMSSYFLNLFDVTGGGTYTVRIGSPGATGNRPPVLGYASAKTRRAGEPLGFVVTATDPDGTVPQLTAASLPQGAAFEDDGNGKASFHWTPGAGQTGAYTVEFVASDGVLESRRTVVITVLGPNQAPVAVADVVQTLEGKPVSIAVLANDSDDSGLSGVLPVLITQPARGSVTTSGTSLVYAPVWGFTGSVSFAYAISDNEGLTSTPAVVTVGVRPDGETMSIVGSFSTNPLVMTRTSPKQWMCAQSFTQSTGAVYRFLKNGQQVLGDLDQTDTTAPVAGQQAEVNATNIVVHGVLNGDYRITFDEETLSYALFPVGTDQDSDGIADVSDNCPSASNANQMDSDGDGYGDLCELMSSDDRDGDTLPNDWEVRHGLNPDDASDAHADPDRDGLLNIQEFQLGTDPQEATPVVPQLVLMNDDQHMPFAAYNPMTNDCVINLALLPTTNVSIRALVLETSVVERVRFVVNGDQADRWDSYYPYECNLYGGDYYSHWIPVVGTHTMEVVGITAEWPAGIPGITTELKFSITNQYDLTDADGDGMADLWETAHGVSGGELDADGDGLCNREEYERGSDPNVITPLVDAFVLFNIDQNRPVPGYNPITNGAVINYALLSTTNLEIRMTVRSTTVAKWTRMYVDGDENGIDHEAPLSMNLAMGKYGESWAPQMGSHTLRAIPYSGTYPNGIKGLSAEVQFTMVDAIDPADSDADEMPDAWEVFHGLSPLNAEDAVLDPDNDGILTIDEWRQRMDPSYPTPLVVSFSLVHMHTGDAVANLDPMVDGVEIDLGQLPAGPYGIRANVASTSVTQNVRFYADNGYRGDDGVQPFRMAFQHSYTDAIWSPVVGDHVIHVVSQSVPYGQIGIKGPDRYFTFRITESP